MAFSGFFHFTSGRFSWIRSWALLSPLLISFLASSATVSIHVGLVLEGRFSRSALRVLRAHTTPAKFYRNMVPRLEPGNIPSSFGSSQVDSWVFQANKSMGHFWIICFLGSLKVTILFLSFAVHSGCFFTSLVAVGALSQICFSLVLDEDTLPLGFVVDVSRFTILVAL